MQLFLRRGTPGPPLLHVSLSLPRSMIPSVSVEKHRSSEISIETDDSYNPASRVHLRVSGTNCAHEPKLRTLCPCDVSHSGMTDRLVHQGVATTFRF